jgi:Raf kinase inhibitor-like YbhB/YbcL family protein
VHWVYFDLPKDTRELAEGDGAPVPGGPAPLHGRNDFGNLGYGGPCPPQGPAHRYFFKLYALDAPLGLSEGATKADVEAAMQDHVIAEAQLMGTYARAR